MMRTLVVFCALALTVAPAHAQSVLVELFASQNCQACPKAHETMADISAERDDVLVLTWSVDYWDYLGEADPMAMPASSERQAAYVDRFGLRGPYTPQTVYNGRVECPGNRPRDVRRALGKPIIETRDVAISPAAAGWQVSVPAGLAGEVFLVRYKPDGTHATDMVNPVTGVDRLARLPRGGLVQFSPQCADTGCAVIVQGPDYGPVYTVARLD